jgi:hypothetical protein
MSNDTVPAARAAGGLATGTWRLSASMVSSTAGLAERSRLPW